MAKTLKGVRLTVTQAASEFWVGPKTLSSQLKAAGIQAGKDGKFSLKQIATAIYDDENLQRVRLVKERADEKSRENAIGRGEVVNVDEFAALLRVPLEAMRHVVLSSMNLVVSEKDEMLAAFADLWRVVFDDKPPTNAKARAALKAAHEKQTAIAR